MWPIRHNLTPEETAVFKVICPRAERVHIQEEDWGTRLGCGVTFDDGLMHAVRTPEMEVYSMDKDRHTFLAKAALRLDAWHREKVKA